MGSESNRGGADRTVGEEEKKRVELFEVPEIKFTKLFINGSFVDAVSGRTFETRDPRTGDVIATVAEADKEDVNLAVRAARDAFDHGEWPRMSGSDRGRIIARFADLVEQHADDELAALESLDAGKHPAITKAVDIGNAAGSLRYFAGAADKIHGETLKMQAQFQAYTLREPRGVAGIIIPWNFPSTMFAIKVAPALAAGCAMVVKPAEQTPLSALYFAHLAKLAGVPDGVINVVPGFGSTAGAALASHMNVDMVLTLTTAAEQLGMHALDKYLALKSVVTPLRASPWM